MTFLRPLLLTILTSVGITGFSIPASSNNSLSHQRNAITFTQTEKPNFRINRLESSEGGLCNTPNDRTDKNLRGKVKRFFSNGKFSRKNLGKLGLYAVLSYGFVSNLATSICVSVAWFLSCKRSGLSPLAPNQWKYFLGIY
eukprot:CAMPEP_0171479654 /NCGR_PEP_ID=MMETSP0946-20130122/5567_1 /TAXON_ID=109269 /ORGANISM="Vaucheria litorea, Strain CCMP2940" /LENGTH=140 /DNA_ID=CAMNT_0012010653 /DNA_START=32 /DNA_END=451 /DNA_ORIENTATION=-